MIKASDLIFQDCFKPINSSRRRGHTDSVWSVAITPDGQSIVSGSDDETIKIWGGA